ncbi:zf-HC2 domain-containing protein [Saccharopolyspora phatthalungensis]|uniref:Anti-sigma factor RsiW n=1 Tax=Saccharopolyspora phatthalungensis TaxID=664693 RepID=A0A840Q9E4_9PSEU|nr:zf-HC2 domain-containing protein [Saccharopolyspora phatthalungensis]MBB5153403.1 anti-sigma factor RsiW [Saccharopolyspora phatthalungensis]
MTVLHGWGLSEQHLALDAIVALVDGELSPNAHDRAVAHLARCPACTADAAAQRQARAALRAAQTPSISPKLLQALQAIPAHAELPSQPDGLALTEDGRLVAVSRPDQAKRFGTGAVLGSSRPLGGNQQPLGSVPPFADDAGDADEAAPARRIGRRTRQGAGVVFSGLVLGALALMNMPTDEDGQPVQGGPNPLPGEAFSNPVVPASARETLPAAPTTSPAPLVAAVQPPSSPAPAPTTSANSRPGD